MKKIINGFRIKCAMTMLLLIINYTLLISESKAQWSLKTNTEDGKYSLVTNSESYFGISSGKISSEAVLLLTASDTSMWRLVNNADNGYHSLAENKVSFMGVDSGKIKTKAVYILNPSTLSSLGLDTTRLAYLSKSNSFIGRKQEFDTVNAAVKYLLNGNDINTSGTLSNVAYLNQNASINGRYTINDLMNFQDSVQLGSAYIFFANGKVYNTKSYSTDTLFANFVSVTSYYMGTNRILYTASNNLNLNSSAGKDLLLGTSTAGSIFTFQSALGNITYTPGTVSGSASTPAIDISQTWNTSGTPTAFKLNITNAASGSSSLLVDLQVGGSSVFSVRRDGKITATSIVSDDSSKGAVLKDSSGHYWRITVSTGGVLSTTDLGTSLTGF